MRSFVNPLVHAETMQKPFENYYLWIEWGIKVIKTQTWLTESIQTYYYYFLHPNCLMFIKRLATSWTRTVTLQNQKRNMNKIMNIHDFTVSERWKSYFSSFFFSNVEWLETIATINFRVSIRFQWHPTTMKLHLRRIE